MASYTSTATLPPAAPRSTSGHAKLHKRGSSGSSLPVSPSPLVGSFSQFTTPLTTSEGPSVDTTATLPPSSTHKIKPYLRKISASNQDDQGKLDLSKSAAENEKLAGLGIHDFNARAAADVTFARAGRRGTHARTTSGSSQVSTGSGSHRANQPFVHPMRQTPRPYTPPTGSSNTSFVDAEEARESSDIVDEELKPSVSFRSRRSTSISSTPAVAPTPLSQSHTPDDLRAFPKLTSTSQTNLSIISGRSGKSAKSKQTRSRRNTDHSIDLPNSPSSRTSFDKAFSFVSRRSDVESQTREDRIREARRKFEEKEANKDRRMERESMKRRGADEARAVKSQERQRRRSEASERTRMKKESSGDDSRCNSPPKKGRRRNDEKHAEPASQTRSYEICSSADPDLPGYGTGQCLTEKDVHSHARKSHSPQTGWVRFSAWFHTRMLNCAGDQS